MSNLPTPRTVKLDLARRLRELADDLSYNPGPDEVVVIDTAAIGDVLARAEKASAYCLAAESGEVSKDELRKLAKGLLP